MKLPLLPRNRQGKYYERIALHIRAIGQVPLEEPIDPFALARHYKVQVIEPSHIRSLTSNELRLLQGRYGPNWSGATLGLPDGWQLCILNPTHTLERTRATLMEEIGHIVLGHRPTRITTGLDGLSRRDYDTSKERAAYAVGAAALVPYAALFLGLMKGTAVDKIAKSYGVSKELVEYRIKITLLWPFYKPVAARRGRLVPAYGKRFGSIAPQ